MTLLQVFMCVLIFNELFVVLLIEHAVRRQLGTCQRPKGEANV